MTTNNFHNRRGRHQILKNPNYELSYEKPEILLVNGTHKTFKQARKLFKQSLPSVAFSYKGFWLEAEPFDQTENSHPEDGFTWTSYVYPSKEDRDALEDYIDRFIEIYDNPKDLEKDIKKSYFFWKKWDIFHLTTLTINEWQEMREDLQTIEKEIAKKGYPQIAF